MFRKKKIILLTSGKSASVLSNFRYPISPKAAHTPSKVLLWLVNYVSCHFGMRSTHYNAVHVSGIYSGLVLRRSSMYVCI